MDFRGNPDGEYKWILQIKDHFSQFVQLFPMKDKESAIVERILREWFHLNGIPIKWYVACPILFCFRREYNLRFLRAKLTFYSCCDNGTEFRGQVKVLCTRNYIRMIRGRPYHPQTQGSIEIANRTFKNRLRAAQTSYRRKDWVGLLLEIAFIINTTTSQALPRGKTLFDIWFGRPRRWLH